MAGTPGFAGSPLPKRRREARSSGVSLSLGCYTFWNNTTLFLMTSSLFFYCGKQEGPLSHHCKRQTLLLSAKKFSKLPNSCFYNSRFDFKKKKKIKIFGKTHKPVVVYLWTYLQASMRMFCFKSLHMKGKIQGKCCSEAPGYRWFQRISQRLSEQAKARLVGSLNLLVRSR